MSYATALEAAQAFGLTRVGRPLQVEISEAAATGTTTLAAIAAGAAFYIEAIELVPGAAGDFELRSGATVIASVLDANAGGEYVFCEKHGNALGDDIVINRIDSIGMSGSLTYRVLT